MSFRIQALDSKRFEYLFQLSDEELAAEKAERVVVTSKPGFPCRVSLEDAEIGETVVLVNYAHQPHQTAYQASHAIYIRGGVQSAKLSASEVPEVLQVRLLSVRAFNSNHKMIDANVVDGRELKVSIEQFFTSDEISYLHIHNAKPGCFAARVVRA